MSKSDSFYDINKLKDQGKELIEKGKKDYINAENKKHEPSSDKKLRYFHLKPGVIQNIIKHKEDEENNFFNFVKKNMAKITENFQEISEKDNIKLLL